MLTFTNLVAEAQAQTQDSDSDSQTLLERGINQGLHKFRAALRREYTTERKTFSLVADQQFYQLPEDCIRPDKLVITVGDIDYPLHELSNDTDWDYLNSRNNRTSDIPEFFYVRGQDEIGIWPIPSSNASNAAEIVYQARKHDMSAADYSTGTVTVTNGDATVTGSGTTFTANMVGRMFRITTANDDRLWYKIDAYTSATSIELENVYGGDTAAGASFVIGEVPDIPEEYHLAVVDFAVYRYYLRRRDLQTANQFRAEYEAQLAQAKRDYSSKSMSNYIPGRRRRPFNNIFTREPREVS